MAEKIYWKGIEERDQATGFVEQQSREFSDQLPVLSSITEPLVTEGTPSRRDFLKMLGFSVTAAAIAASCDIPVRKSIPYVIRPEEIVPGQANYYATTYAGDGEFASILVKTREGRPIKVEGNKSSVVSKGGTSARAQASVLSLYSGTRYRNPMRAKENITWANADSEIGAKLNEIAASNGKIILFTSTVNSPTALKAIAEFKTKYPSTEHLEYDSVSYSGLLDANAANFGLRAAPDYRFDKAKVIVGIGADYLGTWLNNTEYEGDWALNRRVSKDKKEMSRTFHIESVPTITGFKADIRIAVKPTEELAALIAIYNKVTGSSVAGALNNAKVEKAVEELMANKGASLLVCGSNDSNAQMMTNAINQALGNYGATIMWDRPLMLKKGSDASAVALYNGLKDGSIKGVMFYNANPVFTHPMHEELAALIGKASLSVSFANRADETSVVCQYTCPTSHYLESWGDVEVKGGVLNTLQPTISKLFDTRQFEETMLVWSGNTTPYYEYLQKNWESSYYGRQSKYSGFWAFWDNAIHDGETVLNATTTVKDFYYDTASSAKVAEVAAGGGDVQLKLYESVGLGDGSASDNPWLQELPDPVSKITWDNYIMANPDWVNSNGLNIDPDFKDKNYPVLKLTANGKSVELPVVGVPGTPKGVFGIALGYGKTIASHNDLKVGKNVYHLMASESGFSDVVKNVKWEKTSGVAQLAITQTHHSITHQGLGGMKTRKVVKETNLDDYKKSNRAGNEDREHILEELVTLYYEHPKTGPHWTMAIDLNTCTGCGSCVVACNAENNVPVVGKDQVIRSREMHWLRIDRYFTGTTENPDVVYQPMLCQHCDNAPCENVCPVAATNHSSEGLNQMTYNRCIGTRYCANNCPYKVRRFNWYDFNDADSFSAKYGTENYFGYDFLPGAGLGTTDPLSRMVLNPDVTVRSRGVIEKCSFCVQRLQEAKLTAKKESRPLKDGEATTACQTACSTGAIVFGDRNNKESQVFGEYMDERTFGVIEEIHTMPNVLYKTQVRNRSAAEDAERANTVFPKVETAHEEAHHG